MISQFSDVRFSSVALTEMNVSLGPTIYMKSLAYQQCRRKGWIRYQIKTLNDAGKTRMGAEGEVSIAMMEWPRRAATGERALIAAP